MNKRMKLCPIASFKFELYFDCDLCCSWRSMCCSYERRTHGWGYAFLFASHTLRIILSRV